MWSYYPGVFQAISFTNAFNEIHPLTQENHSRASCVFVSPEVTVGYGIPEYTWDKSPIVDRIKLHIEQYGNINFDYCLAHIYKDGNSAIAWHNDKEALCEEIYSVSLGQPRKFRLRPLEATSGWEVEFKLGNGDLFHMHRGCQLKYKHCVPKETTVTNPRISLTFRKFDRISETLGL